LRQEGGESVSNIERLKRQIAQIGNSPVMGRGVYVGVQFADLQSSLKSIIQALLTIADELERIEQAQK
jgi:hypothetical protein